MHPTIVHGSTCQRLGVTLISVTISEGETASADHDLIPHLTIMCNAEYDT